MYITKSKINLCLRVLLFEGPIQFKLGLYLESIAKLKAIKSSNQFLLQVFCRGVNVRWTWVDLLPEQLELFALPPLVRLGRLLVALTPQGPSLGGGPAPLSLAPGLLRLLCRSGAKCRPLLAVMQLLLQLKKDKQKGGGVGRELRWKSGVCVRSKGPALNWRPDIHSSRSLKERSCWFLCCFYTHLLHLYLQFLVHVAEVPHRQLALRAHHDPLHVDLVGQELVFPPQVLAFLRSVH